MFIDTSKLEPESVKVKYYRSYLNVNNVIYAEQDINDLNKTILGLADGKKALVNNNIDEVCRIMNEFEMNNGQ